MLVIRLVIWDKESTILSIYEMNRYRKDGKKNPRGMDMLLDRAEEAIDKGNTPKFEFFKE